VRSRRTRLLSRRPRLLLLACLLVPLWGCRSWQAASIPPAILIAQERPDVVRVTLADSSVVTLQRPAMVADSIRGSTPEGFVRASVEDVRTLEVRRTSVPKTLSFFVFQAAAIVTFIAVIVDLQPHYRGF